MQRDREEEPLIEAGFKRSPRFGGCFIKDHAKGGSYIVFLPIDSRSGKYELSYENGTTRTEFRPMTAKGVIRTSR